MSQILVIEDDIDFNQILCKVLIKKGYEVLSAINGKEGLSLYEKNLADLVITDILMPEQDGIEVILKLKKMSHDVKIIAISGGGQDISGQEYLQSVRAICNIEHTLTKPFEKDRLLQIIQELLK